MKKIFLSVLVVGFLSCQGGNEAALKQLESALIEGHDVVMPKSMQLGDIKEQMIAKLDSTNTEQLAKAQDISRRLDQAETAMYTWMDLYRSIQDQVTDPVEKLKQFQMMKTQIDSITVITDQAIADAKAF
jgi:hypothetical protein